MKVSVIKVAAFIKINANKEAVNNLVELFNKQAEGKDPSTELDSDCILKWIEHNTKHFNYMEKVSNFILENEPKVLRLEVHNYAPELNGLEFIDGSRLRVPNCTTIKEALIYLARQQ